MKKWIIGTITMIVIAMGALFGVTKFLNYIEEEEKSLKVQKVMDQQEKKVKEEKPQVSEDEIISTMHRMVHQKVKSSEKWGFIEMTNKEISSAKNAVESSTNFKYKSKLLSTLERWEKGDFSQTVEEHNFLWEIQGGDTGKATERLSPEEEKQYVKEMKSK
ncbi:PRK06770 family protein [Bacillus paramycoides]|uniref:PRK06770 family protein n=1 Tax=Bacillus paramycoides TaxID=2026194 RepID=UPI002243C81E|nr:PRK06770 family protein [Bacillus paramycoides]MCW9133763.1 PRK06770 family protein [Bacillus paramycoides]